MKELALQAANGTYSPEQKELMQREFNQLAAQNVQVAEMTRFNGIPLHKNNQTITIMADGHQAAEIQTQSIPFLSADLNDPEKTLAALEQTAESIKSYRGSLGSRMNGLEESAVSLQNKSEEIQKSVSRLADTDIASAAASRTSGQIIAEQAVALQAHSQYFSKSTLSLLHSSSHS